MVNAAPSISSRYPSAGALIVVRAGIPLIDDVGSDLMSVVDGTTVDINGATITTSNSQPLNGTRQTASSVEASIELAKENLSEQLAAFAENTLEYLRQESTLLFDPPNPPKLNVDFKGRHVRW